MIFPVLDKVATSCFLSKVLWVCEIESFFQIPPPAGGGSFNCNLPKLVAINSESHHREMVDRSRFKLREDLSCCNAKRHTKSPILSGLEVGHRLRKLKRERSTTFRWWDSEADRRHLCRLDMNYPPSADGGIYGLRLRL